MKLIYLIFISILVVLIILSKLQINIKTTLSTRQPISYLTNQVLESTVLPDYLNINTPIIFQVCDLNENNYLDLNEFKSCATINKDCPKNRKTCKNNQNILVDKIFYKYSNKSFNGLDINGLNELIIS